MDHIIEEDLRAKEQRIALEGFVRVRAFMDPCRLTLMIQVSAQNNLQQIQEDCKAIRSLSTRGRKKSFRPLSQAVLDVKSEINEVKTELWMIQETGARLENHIFSLQSAITNHALEARLQAGTSFIVKE